MELDFGFCAKCQKISTNSCKAYIYPILELKGKQLHSQEYFEYNWIFNFGEILKTDIVMDFTTHTIKKGDEM